jgi:hypothetical protein
MGKISDWFKHASEEGVNLPFAKDSARPGKPPSVTLFFVYVTNVLAILSLIYLHVMGEPLTATATTCVYSIIWVCLYLLRTLQKAKFSLSDQSIELDSDDQEKDEKN